MRTSVIFFCLLFSSVIILAQKQNNIWYFGRRAGLDFNISPPSAIKGELNTSEGCASISDPNGQLLFYTDGITVWDRNHNVMPNGTGLLADSSSTQAAVIVPLPGSSSKYYLFTSQDNLSEGIFSYSIIDLRLNTGFGDIIHESKNTMIIKPISEKITAVLHSNNKDVWIITHRLNSNEFLSYLLTSAGLETTPIISPIGSFYPSDAFIGPVKASHNGNKIAASVEDSYDIVELFDFNSTTGQLSNFYDLRQLIGEFPSIYGIEFSPNDSLLYLSGTHPGSNLYQIDLEAKQVTWNMSVASGSRYWSLQLGPDKKIYIARGLRGFLDVIHQPNELGMLCEYEESGILLSDSTRCMLGFPQHVPYSFPLDSILDLSLGNDTTLCLGSPVELKVEFPTNCGPTIFLWNDGSNDSTLVVEQSGAYWVDVESSCFTFRDTIHVDFISCLPIVYYSLDSCTAYMSNGTNMDYSEFTPAYQSDLICADVSASLVHRSSIPENKHSCTPGVDNSIAMCISSQNSCFYVPDNQASLIFEVSFIPDPDSTIRLTGLEFYEKSPLTYNWIDGNSGLNNYVRRYAIRILKNGNEIYRNINVLSSRDWRVQTFNFIEEDEFLIKENSVFRFELLPYCTINNGADVSAWDIDEIKIFGGCIHSQNNNSIITGEVLTKQSRAIPGVEMQLAGNLSFTSYQTTITDQFGRYMFDPVEKGNSYFLRCYKNDDAFNGVSTLDLIQIQKHLLGLTLFTTLDQYIAADINRDGKISVIDLVELRKLILGHYSEFPRNTSWRFGSLPQDLNGSDIYQFREMGIVEYLEPDTLKMDFIGIKIGDLTGDVKP